MSWCWACLEAEWGTAGARSRAPGTGQSSDSRGGRAENGALAGAGPGKTSPGDSEGMVTVGVWCGRVLGAGKVVSLSLSRKCMGKRFPQGWARLGKAEHLSSDRKEARAQDSWDKRHRWGHKGCRLVTSVTGSSHKVLVPQWHLSPSPEHLSPCTLNGASLVGTTLT